MTLLPTKYQQYLVSHKGVRGRSPQRGTGAEPLVMGSGGQSPPEAERFLGIIR